MSHVINGILCNARSFTSNSDIFSTTVKTVSRNKLDYRQKQKQKKKKMRRLAEHVHFKKGYETLTFNILQNIENVMLPKKHHCGIQEANL